MDDHEGEIVVSVLLPPAVSAVVPGAIRRLRVGPTPELPALVRHALPSLSRALGALGPKRFQLRHRGLGAQP